jgi:response regulator of citrate/malate metabolism
LDTEELNKIIDIFKKIKDAISADKKADQETIDYIDGLISSLDAAKVKGMDDSKMKEIIDFLSTAGESKDSDEGDKDDKDGDKTAGSDDDQVDI